MRIMMKEGCSIVTPLLLLLLCYCCSIACGSSRTDSAPLHLLITRFCWTCLFVVHSIAAIVAASWLRFFSVLFFSSTCLLNGTREHFSVINSLVIKQELHLNDFFCARSCGALFFRTCFLQSEREVIPTPFVSLSDIEICVSSLLQITNVW